MEKTSLKQSYC